MVLSNPQHSDTKPNYQLWCQFDQLLLVIQCEVAARLRHRLPICSIGENSHSINLNFFSLFWSLAVEKSLALQRDG